MRPRRIFFGLMIVFGTLPLSGPALGQPAAGGGDPLQKVIKGGVLFDDEDINTVIALIGADAGITITKTTEVKGRVTVNFPDDVTVKTLLETITSSIGAKYIVDQNGVIQILTPQQFEATIKPPELRRKRIQIQNRNATDLLKALEALLTEKGQMTVDPANNTITVYDTLEALDRIQKEIQNLDTPLKTIIFNLRYVSAKEVADTLREILVGEPDIQINERLNQVVLRDTVSNILRAQLYVEQIDKDRELRVYHINFAWENYDQIASLIEKFASENAVIETWEERRLIIVEDIPARQERIEQLVKAIDLPTRQVLIEAEIVRISNSLTFEFGTEFNYASTSLVDATSISPQGMRVGGLPVNNNLTPFARTDSGWEGILSIPEGGPITFFGLKDDQFQFQIRALESKGLAETISSPRVIVRNDQDASLKVGTEEPYATRQRRIGSGNVDDTEYYTQRSREVGTLLEVTPHIMDNGYIDMEVFLEDSDAEQVFLSGSNLDALRVFKRTAETRLVIRDGRTIAIGGLYERDRSDQVNSVPFLSRIPVVGDFLFRSKKKSDIKNKLVLFVTPYIVSLDDPFGKRKDYDLEQFGTQSSIDAAASGVDFFPDERKYEIEAQRLIEGGTAAVQWSRQETEIVSPLQDAQRQPTPDESILDKVLSGGVDIDQDVHSLGALLAKSVGVKIVVDNALQGEVKFSTTRDVTLRNLLDMICLTVGAEYKVRGDTIYLRPAASRPTSRSEPPASGALNKGGAAVDPAAALAQRRIEGGVRFDAVPIEQILTPLSTMIGAPITMSKGVRGKVRARFDGPVTAEEVLHEVCQSVGAQYVVQQDGSIHIQPAPAVTQEERARRRYTLRHQAVDRIAPQIQEILSDTGSRMQIDAARNSFEVYDTPEVHRRIGAALKALDIAGTNLGGAATSATGEISVPSAAPQGMLHGGVDFENIPLEDAVAQLSRRSGIPIRVSREIRKKTVLLGMEGDVEVEEVLRQLASRAGAKMVRNTDGSVDLLSAGEWLNQRAPEHRIRRRIVIQNRPAEEIRAEIVSLLTPETGSVSLDADGNALLLEDTVAVLARVEGRIKELDAAPPSPQEPLARKRVPPAEHPGE